MGNVVEPIKDIKMIDKIEKLLGPRDGLIWAIGTQIGLRISDILSLDINFVGNDFYFLYEQKTGKAKKFPISKELKLKIQNYYENYRKKSYTYKNDERSKDALFISRKHTRIFKSTFYRNLVAVCKKLGIQDNIGTHTMRKTFGYHHYKQFNDIALLQKIFNHSSPNITLRYIGLDQERINESYKNFSYKKQNIKPPTFEFYDEILKKQNEINQKLDKILKMLKQWE